MKPIEKVKFLYGCIRGIIFGIFVANFLADFSIFEETLMGNICTRQAQIFAINLFFENRKIGKKMVGKFHKFQN